MASLWRCTGSMPPCHVVAPHISIHIGQIPKTRKLSWSEGQCDMHQCHVSQDPEYAAAIGSKLHEKDWGWFCWDGIHALVAGWTSNFLVIAPRKLGDAQNSQSGDGEEISQPRSMLLHDPDVPPMMNKFENKWLNHRTVLFAVSVELSKRAVSCHCFPVKISDRFCSHATALHSICWSVCPSVSQAVSLLNFIQNKRQKTGRQEGSLSSGSCSCHCANNSYKSYKGYFCHCAWSREMQIARKHNNWAFIASPPSWRRWALCCALPRTPLAALSLGSWGFASRPEILERFNRVSTTKKP